MAVGLGLLWAALVLIGQLAGAFSRLERPLLDWRQGQPTPVPLVDQDMALIEIDHIPANREWPFPRLDYAILLQSVQPYGPQSVIFEMPLYDRDTRYSAFDSTFARQVSRMNEVIFAGTVLALDDKEVAPRDLDVISRKGSRRRLPHFHSVRWPLPIFAKGAPVGISNTLMEAEAQPRLVPLVFYYRGRLIPSLALQAVARRLKADFAKSEAVLGEAFYLRDADGNELRVIPIDQEGRLRMRYRPAAPQPWRASFDDIPLYAQTSEAGREPGQNLEELRRRMVWVGRTDRKVFEGIPGVVGKLAPVEVQMLAARNILAGDFIRSLSPWVLIVAFLVVGGVGALLLVHYGKVPALVLLGVMLWSWWETSLLAFRSANLDVPMFSFAVLIIGMVPVGYAAKNWELKEKEETDEPRPAFPGPNADEVMAEIARTMTAVTAETAAPETPPPLPEEAASPRPAAQPPPIPSLAGASGVEESKKSRPWFLERAAWAAAWERIRTGARWTGAAAGQAGRSARKMAGHAVDRMHALRREWSGRWKEFRRQAQERRKARDTHLAEARAKRATAYAEARKARSITSSVQPQAATDSTSTDKDKDKDPEKQKAADEKSPRQLELPVAGPASAGKPPPIPVPGREEPAGPAPQAGSSEKSERGT